MTSRERVWAAVNYRRPDRLPIDLGGIRASGCAAFVYDRMKRRRGIETPTKIQDTMQLLAEIEPELLEALHIDVVPLEIGPAAWAMAPASRGQKRRLFCGIDAYIDPAMNITEEPNGDWLLRDAAGEPYARMPKDGYYFDFIRTTMSDHKIDPDAFRPADSYTDEQLEAFRRHAESLYANTDKALLGWGASISMLGLSALLSDNITQGSLDQWYLMLMAEKETANEMMGRATDAAIARLALAHEAVGDKCFAWGVASDDAGTQRGEAIAPDLFAEMIAPHYKRICDWVHEHTNWKTYLHSCGSIYRYIPLWIEAGIDILNPVQISAANMSPENLMERFSGKIVFWGGGCDTQHVLPSGTPDEVREHVKHNIDVFTANGTQGGYVFTQVHNIQQNVPVENVEAMFETACEYGKEVYRK